MITARLPAGVLTVPPVNPPKIDILDVYMYPPNSTAVMYCPDPEIDIDCHC